MYNTLGSMGRSLNVYAMYKMRVISQNSRRKASAEDERSNVLYCMHNTLQSAARSLKKCTVSRPKMKIQGLSIQLPIFRCKGTDQYVRVWSKMAFRTRQAAATFSLFMHQYGRSFLLPRWRFSNKQSADYCRSPSFSGWRFKYILTAANFLLRKNKYGCSLSYLY
jgi:hypothetical protein